MNYAVTRGKGNFSFRFSQPVTAASYSEADVSARPNSLTLFTDLYREQHLFLTFFAVADLAAAGAHKLLDAADAGIFIGEAQGDF